MKYIVRSKSSTFNYTFDVDTHKDCLTMLRRFLLMDDNTDEEFKQFLKEEAIKIYTEEEFDKVMIV